MIKMKCLSIHIKQLLLEILLQKDHRATLMAIIRDSMKALFADILSAVKYRQDHREDLENLKSICLDQGISKCITLMTELNNKLDLIRSKLGKESSQVEMTMTYLLKRVNSRN